MVAPMIRIKTFLKGGKGVVKLKFKLTEPVKGSSLSSTELPMSKKEISCLQPIISDGDNRGFQKPVINVGFPKMGSNSLTSFFKCGNISSSHYWCKDGSSGKQIPCGVCMNQAVANGKPPLQSCGGFEFYGEMNYVTNPPCYWPQIDLLDEIHEEAPNATFILVFRDIESWTTSVRRWKEINVPFLIDALSQYCEIGSTDAELEMFFCNQVINIRHFVKTHPSHKLVELKLEDTETTSNILFKRFGIDQGCWGHKNENPKDKKFKDKGIG